MRYLIFNITVLSALGYLFMASPDQSFTSWLGKAPQMFDAARTAGRDAGAAGDPSETAGTALLEAMEPVIEEVLAPKAHSAADRATADQIVADRIVADGPTAGQVASSRPATEQGAAAVDSDNQPVTMRDIETMIRALLETRTAPAGTPDAVNAANHRFRQAPDDGGDKASVENRPAIVDAPPKPVTSELAAAPPAVSVTEPDITGQTAAAGNGSGTTAPAISEEMSDADIAAAFAQLQQSATEGDVATAGPAIPEQPGPAGDVVAAPATPAYMSPGQRADSLALMVEELQLMYLERTGG
jgi:hypothetical protein